MKFKVWYGLPLGFGILFALGITVLDPLFMADLAAYFVIIYGGIVIYDYAKNRKAKQKTPI